MEITAEANRTTSRDTVSDASELRFRFHGNGAEYFGIWIVNILLSIVTLGIYSAWAKVRTKRYFNGNTELDGHRFDYHANPVAILKGRILVIVILFVLNILTALSPMMTAVIIIFYMVALPWVIVRGLRFNANMTSYRNVRFHFVGRKRDAAVAYLILPALASITLGVILPFLSRANARFLGNGYRFGQSKFSAELALRPYYKAYGVSLVYVAIALMFALVVVGFGSMFARLRTH